MDKLRNGILSDHSQITEDLGARMAACLPSNSAIALSGDLGTGKTTFARGLARGLGITTNVTSPTYNIFSVYQGRMQLLHMDAYRLQDARDLASLAIDDILKSPFLIAVEWPENVRGFFDEYPSYWLRFEITQEHSHKIALLRGGD